MAAKARRSIAKVYSLISDAARRRCYVAGWRFIYFSSDRPGRAQIRKAPAEGGDPVQITRRGDLYAVEPFDGKSIYFTTDIPAEVWQTSANGGEETVLLRKATSRVAQLEFFRFADHSSRTLASIDRPVHEFLSSSLGGRSALYTRIDSRDHDLMIVDPYR